jgi:hypothetical protein
MTGFPVGVTQIHSKSGRIQDISLESSRTPKNNKTDQLLRSVSLLAPYYPSDHVADYSLSPREIIKYDYGFLFEAPASGVLTQIIQLLPISERYLSQSATAVFKSATCTSLTLLLTEPLITTGLASILNIINPGEFHKN